MLALTFAPQCFLNGLQDSRFAYSVRPVEGERTGRKAKIDVLEEPQNVVVWRVIVLVLWVEVDPNADQPELLPTLRQLLS